jgi:hypothetical protein
MLLKGELHQPHDYITNVTFCWLPTQVWSRIRFASSRETEYYGVNSKGGVNVQVTLKKNRAKRELPV